ncbi:DUF169 domain-containing protein [Thermodesulfobacteriota bacterium]
MYDFEKPRGTKDNILRVRKIESHLRLPTLPVGIKLFEKGDKVPEGLGEEPHFKGTYCQFMSQARFERCQVRKNYLIRRTTLICPYALGVLGFEEWGEEMATGKHFGGVHFESDAQAIKSQSGLPKIEPYTIEAILVGPLMDLTVTPDLIGFSISPGMSNKVFDGAMWDSGEPMQMTYHNMCGICGTGTAEAYLEKSLTVNFPCHGGRRMGLFFDNELWVALHNDFFDKWISGMEKAYASGHAYPTGHYITPNPGSPPHFKILEWPDKIVPLDH